MIWRFDNLMMKYKSQLRILRQAQDDKGVSTISTRQRLSR